MSKSIETNESIKYFKIRVRTLEGHILTFRHIKKYEFEGTFIKFKDAKTKEVKRFESSNCEIEEVLVTNFAREGGV